MSTTCRSCDAKMRWAETVPGGRRVPLDIATVDQDQRGALILLGGRFAYSLGELAERIAQKEAVSIGRAKELIRTRYDAHLSHFATCPRAEQHRRARR